jgi:HlyD family secretion protein
MDVQRTDVARQKKRKRTILIGVALAAVLLISFGLAQLEPAAPTVEGGALYFSTVERGEMLRQVRGPGTLVPESLQWITAATQGRVERILVLPGTVVEANTILLELSSPELEQQIADATSELRAVEADYVMLEAQLESQVLTQESVLAQVVSEHSQAKLQLEANERLAAEGLLPEIDFKRSQLATDQLETLEQIERVRLEKARRSTEAQLQAGRSRLEQQRALMNLRQQQFSSLQVRAGMEGVLQEVRVEEGQRVTAGSTLAQVAQPDQLKAELRIPETQAKDLRVGLAVSIDTRNGIVPGRLSRVDPAVREGSVTVDVALEGALPQGARPDLRVDGTIEIERLEDVLYVGRPAYGQANQTVSLFLVDEEEDEARRVQVRLGRSSVSTVEVVDGLQEGDRVILSDTSKWDDFDRIRIE